MKIIQSHIRNDLPPNYDWQIQNYSTTLPYKIILFRYNGDFLGFSYKEISISYAEDEIKTWPTPENFPEIDLYEESGWQPIEFNENFLNIFDIKGFSIGSRAVSSNSSHSIVVIEKEDQCVIFDVDGTPMTTFEGLSPKIATTVDDAGFIVFYLKKEDGKYVLYARSSNESYQVEIKLSIHDKPSRIVQANYRDDSALFVDNRSEAFYHEVVLMDIKCVEETECCEQTLENLL